MECCIKNWQCLENFASLTGCDLGNADFLLRGKEGGKHDDFNSSFDGERNEKSFLGEGGKMHLFL